jgi:hypothetical protein
MRKLRHAFRIEPEFVYMDLARGQYIGVWPASKRGEWQVCAARTRSTFDDALGKNAPASAASIGARLEVRAVFGWPALVEKLLARQAGIDDRTLEAAKLAVMRSQEETPTPGRLELRMIGREQRRPGARLGGTAPAKAKTSRRGPCGCRVSC